MVAFVGRGSIVLLLICAAAAAAEPFTYFPPPDDAGGWRTATNAAQIREVAQMDVSRLQQAWEFTQRCTQNAGLLVARNGWLVFEKYVGRAGRNANPDMARRGELWRGLNFRILRQGQGEMVAGDGHAAGEVE